MYTILVHHKWNEVLSRSKDYIELKRLIRNKNLDLEAIAEWCNNFYVLKGFIGTKIQVQNFFKKDKTKARELIRKLIGENPPDANKINLFIKESVQLAFHDKKMRAKQDNAALFASVLLTAVFPDNFVDFRQNRWNYMAKIFKLRPMPENTHYGEKLIWAGQIAKEFAGKRTFKKFLKQKNVKDNWVVAGLAWLLPKEFEKEIREVFSELKVSMAI